jgi:hypothetical protein
VSRQVLSFAFFAYGYAFRDADPFSALDALRRGLVIAQDSGNRSTVTHLAVVLPALEAEYRDPQAALNNVTLAIRDDHDSGNASITVPLAVLAALSDRLGRYEPAATIARFAINSLAAAAFPEITTAITHLRDVLGEEAYESG